MLLSLFRLSTMVLLFSAVYVEIDGEKSSFVSSEKDKALAEISPDSNSFPKEESLRNPKEILLKKRQVKNNRHFNQHGAKRRGANVENRISRSGDGNLAQKMAKEALKSPQMQHTMNKLTRGKSSKKNLIANIKLSSPAKIGKSTDLQMNNGKPVGLKRKKKKKRKRHHRRYRNQHGVNSKRGAPKRPLNTRRDTSVSARKLNGKENSINKRNQATVKQKSRNKFISKSNEKITAVKIDDSDYVDFSSISHSETTILPISHRSSVKLDDGESMVERLMRTTTKDPSKKPPGDRGVEYSDYYSEDDVLQDIAANKIPMGVAENPSERFTREIFNSSGFLDNQIDRNAQTCRNHDARGTDFRYTDDSLDNFQNYPSLEHFGLNRHSRLHGADAIDFYGHSADGYANLDTGYPARIGQAVKPSITKTISDDLDAHTNSDSFDQQIQPEDINYYNRYEPQQGGRLDNNYGVNVPRYFNAEEDARLENLHNFSPNENVDTAPQFYNKFDNTETPDSYSYQQGSDSQRFNQNTKAEEEDVALQNYPAQTGNHNDLTVPPYIVDLIDLPLGKFLDALGIHVYTEPNPLANFTANLQSSTPINLIDNVDSLAPVSEIQSRAMEHFMSPSYLKKNTKKDSYSYNTKIHEKGNHSCVEASKTQSNHSHDALPHATNHSNSVRHDNISITMHDTKEVASQILDTIIDELNELKLDRTKNNQKDGLPCRISGSWSTTQAGMKLDMKVVNHSIIVTLSDLASTKLHESLLNATWNVSGQAPFKRGSPFTLVATDNSTNSLAVFVGACRVCQGVDTIAGVWSVARQPKDCKDFQVGTSVFNDIFWKSKLSSLKEKEHNANATEKATEKKQKKRN